MKYVCLLLLTLPLATVYVDATTANLCNDIIEILGTSKSSRRNYWKNAVNRACTAMELIRNGINPLELLTVPDSEVTTRRPRRNRDRGSTSTTTTTTTTTTTPAPTTTTYTPPADDPSPSTTTLSPLEIIFRHPQVNVIFTNGTHHPHPGGVRSNDIAISASSTNRMETRIAVDAPKHLLPKNFNPNNMKTPYPAVYEIRTSFQCSQQTHIPGVYADMSLKCMAFHLCAATDPYHNMTSFVCPHGLLFSQKDMLCEYPQNVKCQESYKNFYSNEDFAKKFDIKYVVLGKVN